MTKKEIGALLRKFRISNQYSVEQVVNALEECDIHIAAKTYYGYEAGTNKPNLDIFLALCKVYKYDILELICEFPSIREKETQILRNYQALDASGKSIITALVKHELERTKTLKHWKTKAELQQRQLTEIKKVQKHSS